MGKTVWRVLTDRDSCFSKEELRLTFPSAKLRRHVFMTRAEAWAKNWAKFSAHFRVSFAVQNGPQIFSQYSSQLITPCLVAEVSIFFRPRASGVWGPLEWGLKTVRTVEDYGSSKILLIRGPVAFLHGRVLWAVEGITLSREMQLPILDRVFLNPWFGEPMVCTLDSRGFRHFRGFRDFRESSTQLLVYSG